MYIANTIFMHIATSSGRKWLHNFIFLICLIHLVAIVKSQFPTQIYFYFDCPDNDATGLYTRNSTYERNLDTSLSSVPPNIDANGFYNASTGENPDTVNIIALCRADLQPSQCRDYVENATAEILLRCPYKKRAILWHEFCMVRYSNEAIFGTLAISPMRPSHSRENVTNTEVFYWQLNVLLNSLQEHAAFNSLPKKFAASTWTVNDTNHPSISAFEQCTPDITPEECGDCLNKSAQRIRECCEGAKGVRVLTPSCYLRFETDTDPFYNASMVEAVPQPPTPPMPPPPSPQPPVWQMKQAIVWKELMKHALMRPEPNGVKKLALNGLVGQGKRLQPIQLLELIRINMNYQIYIKCLSTTVNKTKKLPADPTRAAALARHQLDPPLHLKLINLITRSRGWGKGKGKNTTRTIIIVIVPIAVCLILALCIGIYLKTKKMRKPREKVDLDEEISTVESLQYDFGTIRVATDNFSDVNKLGQGGFGVVYKGKLPNGKDIAVKRLSHDSGQGNLEFKNEVLLVARLQHRNLVRLLGFSVEGNERLLIYEWVQNGSLDRFIFDSNNPCLDWEKRYIIIGGVAKGLLYLHEDSRLRIIHRDLKASNVLLDGKINPKISDFDMARLFLPSETQHSTSRIVGTYGYMAPEYVLHGHFSVKSDVYSFGVLILEIISGQKTYNFRNGESGDDLISCVWKNWHQETVANIIDPALRTSSGSMRDIMRCIHIGLLCVQENATDRPTMGSVVLMLSSFSLTLAVPSRPAFFMSGSFRPEILALHKTHSSTDQSENTTHLSTNEASMSELYPR
ncbi:cysteine-rich receptor-like protein kinase 25 [Olea europaea var. sylvestris]|uniref:cysteine-rich receptor-like protein kinase 25 n=1 Tax=Olea europaea var. sylvestris TaxID=158386 RepID=UPI000C1D373F|nr:cysteine-rich receptor-like protein kinase 25 [Olea europaea var. sylvestris]